VSKSSLARRIFIGLTVMLILVLAGWTFAVASKTVRKNLWRVVNYGCVLNQRAFGLPAPCEKVDLGRGFAVVPSLEGAELLLVPTLRIRGIEDSRLLDPQTPNYWADAWAERSKLTASGQGVPDDWVGLAVNSARSRTQDQLHIHIDCIKSSTYDALHRSHIGPNWGIIEPLPGQSYWARYLDDVDFRSVSLFRIVATSGGGSPKFMERQTIVAVRANGGVPGFYILRQASDRMAHTRGVGEELLDHQCSALLKALRGSDRSSRR